jgi:UDP-3-O-[3-hydroxymyristoyl] N-acetylglucosamine deacetylase
LKTPISCSGIGLHSGRQVTMTLHPAKPDSGIRIRRTDPAAGGVTIPAHWRNVVDTRMCTTLGVETAEGKVKVGTVEHLLAAIAGCHIDNILIEIDGPEIPVMDGSSAPFVFLIDCAGIAEQAAHRRAIQVLRSVSVGDEQAGASLKPASSFSISFEIDFEATAIAKQDYFVVLDNGAFRSEIARARTFGMAGEVERLRAAGLALGGSLDNAVVVDGDRIVNADGLRYEDEFVRHKILDAVGDLSLAGAPILGHFHGFRSGHGMHNKLLRALFADSSAWRSVPLEDADGEEARPARRLAASA